MLTGTIAEHVLLYWLPIIGSYTGGTMPETSSDYSSRKQTADYISRRQAAQHAEHWTPKHDTNGRPPKVYKP